MAANERPQEDHKDGNNPSENKCCNNNNISQERPEEEQQHPKRDRSSRNTCCNHAGKGCTWHNPVVLFGTAYFGATIALLFTANVPFMPDLSDFFITGNMLYSDLLHLNNERAVILIALWGIHFVRRFAEVLFLISYDKSDPETFCPDRKMGVVSIFYFSFFGLWIGWSVNYNLGYLTPLNFFFIPGIIMFSLGELANIVCHIILRRRKRTVSFRYYLYETITWLGYAFATFTLASWIFVFSRSVMMFIYHFSKKQCVQERCCKCLFMP